jgi:hypothetical protein
MSKCPKKASEFLLGRTGALKLKTSQTKVHKYSVKGQNYTFTEY